MNYRLFSLFVSLIALVAIAPSAKADWYEASSDHFVIYADDSPKDIRRFAENLERYHSALVYLTGRDTGKPSPSNRVTIFVAGSGRDIKRLMGGKNRNIAGFYLPRAGGSKAFVQNIRNKDGYPHFSTVVLLHEYAHHFLISGSRYAMPRWMSEGAAEFFAAATFKKDGSVMIGRPAQHRAYELSIPNAVTARELLDPDLLRKNKGPRGDGFYARSWLLYHYLTFSKERVGQLNEYWRQIAQGKPSIEAGEAVFGDLDQLEKELKAYLRERRMFTFSLAPERFKVGQITLRELPEGEAKAMDLRMVSQRGVTREQAEELVIEVRKIAQKYPYDPGVLSGLAEAEYDAGNDDAAIAAADKAITLDPARTNPYVQKGYALFRKASEAEDAGAAYKAAMAPFSALNKREPDHPIPLIYYYRSFAERGLEPPENAKLALERAAQLSPFDERLWLQVAMMQAGEGKIELAKGSLQPLTANPHGGQTAEIAQNMLAVLDGIPDGQKLSLRPGSRPVRVVPASASEGEDDEGDDGADADGAETDDTADANAGDDEGT